MDISPTTAVLIPADAGDCWGAWRRGVWSTGTWHHRVRHRGLRLLPVCGKRIGYIDAAVGGFCRKPCHIRVVRLTRDRRVIHGLLVRLPNRLRLCAAGSHGICKVQRPLGVISRLRARLLRVVRVYVCADLNGLIRSSRLRDGGSFSLSASAEVLQCDYLQAVVVREVDRIILAVEIAVQTDPIGDAAAQSVLLREAVHLRLVESRAEVDHSRGGVIVLAVVAKAGCCLAELLPERGVALAGDLLFRQADEDASRSVVRDFSSYACSSVVNILRAGASGDRGNALQAVGVVGRLAVLGSRDDHAVPIQNIPRQRSCQIFTCADLA